MNYLKRPKLLISAAWLLHVMAWFLPVIKDGARLPSGLPGWEAFRAASSVFYSRSEFKDWYFAVIAAVEDKIGVIDDELLQYRTHPLNTIKTGPVERLKREVLWMNMDLLYELAPKLAL